MAERGDWWYDERLRAVRNWGLALHRKRSLAELNLTALTRYADGPVDEEEVDDLILEIAQWNEALAAHGREHVRLRREVRAGYAARAGEVERGGTGGGAAG